MYGYVRPLKGELKVSEYESFQSVYCGLCHSLKERGGFAARFLVNYDLTFLAMLLSEGKAPCTEKKHCPARLWGKKRCLCQEPALDTAADQSLILGWWKLRDDARDSQLWKRLFSRFLLLLYRRPCREAALRQPEFAAAVEEHLQALNKLEDELCGSLDAVADKFALILKATAHCIEDEDRRRVLEELLYHLGRVVYLLDAVDDLPEDVEQNSYNPIRYRYQLSDRQLSPEDREALHGTLRQSVNRVIAAYELLEKGPWDGILSNVVYLGLPWVTEAVFSGQWRELTKLKKNRTEHP